MPEAVAATWLTTCSPLEALRISQRVLEVCFLSSMVCTDHIDHDPHVLGFGLTDQILQIGFASESFIETVDVLQKGSTTSLNISAVRETLRFVRSIVTHLGPVTVVRLAKRCVASDILAKETNSVVPSASNVNRDLGQEE